MVIKTPEAKASGAFCLQIVYNKLITMLLNIVNENVIIKHSVDLHKYDYLGDYHERN